MEEIQKGRNITIWQGYENRTYVGSIYDEHEFFYPAYCQAARCINEIVDTSRRYQDKQATQCSGCGRELRFRPALRPEQELLSYPNNVVAFCAKRGQGKTSAMVSVSKALEDMNRVDGVDSNKIHHFWANAGRDTQGEHTADQYRYSVVDPIDPTTMEQNDSVLRNVLSRLFTRFCHTWEQRENERRNGMMSDCTEQDRELLLKAFTKCFQSLDDLKRGTVVERYDDLTRLSEVGDSVRMKKDFAELVRVFLKFEGADMLVIQIDDADLNTARTFGIVEDIRRYCVVPQVIVLMAVHLGTLRSCIEQHNVRGYEYLLRTDLEIKHLDQNKCREMAERYVDKLLPGLHQVHLPYVEDEIRKRSNSPNLYYWTRDGRDLLDFSEGKERQEKNYVKPEKLQYVNRLIRLVYEKTGILLMPAGGYMHHFMPRRSRDLTHFLSFFTSLDSVEPSGAGSLDKLLALSYWQYEMPKEAWHTRELLQRRIHNLEELETYFFQHWCAVNLTQSQNELIEEIMHATRPAKHTKTLECLWRYQEEQEKARGNDDAVLSFHKALARENITYGDVIQALNDLKTMHGHENHYDFIYAIQLYYTIFMNKLVCTCLSQGRDLSDLLSFCGNELFPRQLYESGGNYSGRFVFKTSLLSQAAREKVFTNEDTRWSRFAAITGKGRQPLLIRSQDQERGVLSINRSFETAQFDVFYALFGVIEEFGNNLREETWRKETDVREFCQELASVLQLICNYDLQYRVRKYCLETGLGEADSKGNYSDWVARLFQTIDALVMGEEEEWMLVSTQLEMQEIRRQKTLQYDMPAQWLPVTSCLGNLVDKESLANISVRQALDAMYGSQEDQHKKYVFSVIEKVIKQIEKAIRGIGKETVVTNQSDWWVGTRRNLFDYLRRCLNINKMTGFQTVFFTNSSNDAAVRKQLKELYQTLKSFDDGERSYTGMEMRNTLYQYRSELNTLKAKYTGKKKSSKASNS